MAEFSHRVAVVNWPARISCEFLPEACAGFLPRLSKRRGKIPEVAQKPFVEAAHHGHSLTTADDGCGQMARLSGAPGPWRGIGLGPTVTIA